MNFAQLLMNLYNIVHNITVDGKLNVVCKIINK